MTSSCDWSVVGAGPTGDAAAPPAAPGTPTEVTTALLKRLLPGKADAKLEGWVAALRDEEIETVEDAAALLSDENKDDWDKLPLPAAIRATLREEFRRELTAKRLQGPAVHADPVAAVEAGSEVEDPPIQQLDCIVLDVSGSMKSRSAMDPLKTREDVSKFTFHLMVDKFLGLEMQHAVSLISFGRDIATVKELTLEYETFHDEMGRLDARQSATRLYDAVDRAAALLLNYKAEHAEKLIKDCPLRIFALTDGDDNASTQPAWEVARRLQEQGILLDVLPLGNPNTTLQAMATATGGLCVDVVDEQQAVTLFNREALMHVHSRDEEERKARPAVGSAADLAQHAKQATVVKDVAASHDKKLMQSKTLKTSDVAAAMESQAKGQAKTANQGSLRRVMKEFSEVHGAGGTWEVHVSEEDVCQWKVLLQSSKESVYAGAWFGLSVKFPSDFPFKAPAVRFTTPVYHCNVSNDGVVCLDVLMSNWSPAVHMPAVLDALRSLLANPNADDPLDAWKGQLLKSEPERYYEAAKKFTEEKAHRDVEAARAAMNITC